MQKGWLFGLTVMMALSGAGEAKENIHNVQFSHKMPSLVTEGSVVRGDRDVFLLNAGRDQRMTVHVETVEHNGCVEVKALGGDLVGGSVEESEAGITWVGVLPKAGAYSVAVSPTRGNATYKLEVSVSE